MRKQLLIWTAAIALCVSSARAEEPKELPAYLPMADKLVVRDAAAGDAIFYASTAKAITTKLAEYKVEFPKVELPDETLFVVVVSDHVGESFKSVSGLQSQRLLVIDLQEDKKFKAPADAPEGKKNSRLLLVACPPLPGIRTWAINTANGERHEVAATEVK